MFPVRNGLKQGDAILQSLYILLWSTPLGGFR